MAKQFEDRGIDIPSITKFYHLGYNRTLANTLIFTVAFWKMPRWLYKILLKKVYPVHIEQQLYPIFYRFCRTGYLLRRAFDHVRFMDFSLLPGKIGHILWKLRIISFWQRFIVKQYHLPKHEYNNLSETPKNLKNI